MIVNVYYSSTHFKIQKWKMSPKVRLMWKTQITDTIRTFWLEHTNMDQHKNAGVSDVATYILVIFIEIEASLSFTFHFETRSNNMAIFPTHPCRWVHLVRPYIKDSCNLYGLIRIVSVLFGSISIIKAVCSKLKEPSI